MILTLDFETYYDKTFSLRKLTTEEYIRSNQFAVHGVGLKSGDQPSAYIWTDVKGFLNQIDWSQAYVLCHNTRFDGAILSWRYGIRPRFLLDTLSMARAVFPHESGSLANLSKLCGLGEKGNDLVNFAGKRDLAEEEQVALGRYCMNDVDLTYKLFQTMKSKFAPSELKVIDQTLRMFTEPVLELDEKVLFDHLQKIQVKQAKLLDGRDLTSLRSNPQFAKQLVALGVDPPTKISARTQKVTFAFAKTDEGMLSLLEHPDVEVQALAAARLGVKSSIEETRTKAFLSISERGPMPVPLNYFGAQNTGRFSGSDGLNLQNLPRGGELRKAIIAPAGHVLVVSDFSQIEARMIAWLAGQEELLQQFRDGDDVYCRFASKIYGRVITKEDKRERFLGKVCLAEGTVVLCRCGWKPIETITSEDELWDGDCWVRHQGLLNNGIAQTLNLCGLWLTPDHQMWSGEKWITAQSAAADENSLSRVLATGAENLPSQGTSWECVVGSLLSSLGAIAKTLSTELTTTTSGTSKAPDVIYARNSQRTKNVFGSTRKPCQTTSTEGGFLTGCLRRLLGATTRSLSLNTGFTTDTEESPFMRRGGKTEWRFSSTFKRFLGGMFPSWKWTGSTPTETTNRETLDSPRNTKICATNEGSQTRKKLSQVYDIACAGPKNRFTVLSQRGPLIVHNCILGLGYSLGWRKLATILATGPMGQAPILFTAEDLETMDGRMEKLDTKGITTKLTGRDLAVHCSAAKHLVDTYRNSYDRIPNYWQTCERILSAMHRGVAHQFGCISTEKDRVLMPNGLYLQYKDLRKDEEGSWRYTGKRGEKQYIYGGKLAENCLAKGTMVVVYSGIKPIEAVTVDDLMWDGVEWVRHGGVSHNGVQEVGEWQGIRLTGNHLILVGNSWRSATVMDDSVSLLALGLGRSLAPAWLNRLTLAGNGGVPTFSVPVGERTKRSIGISGEKTPPLVAHGVLGSGSGNSAERLTTQFRLGRSALCGRIGIRAWFRDAMTRTTRRIQTTVEEVSASAKSGLATAINSFAMLCPSLIGTNLDWTWIGSTTRATTNQGTSDCVRAEQTQKTAEIRSLFSTAESPTHTERSVKSIAPHGLPTPLFGISNEEKPRSGSWISTGKPEEVFDILNCGPRNRFMVVTENGPVIVHNCVQALSRIVLTDAMLAVGARCKIVLTVHDEVVVCVREEEAGSAADVIEAVMSVAPAWCKDLPVACETSVARSYGEAK